jgi:hypothetical protein
LVARDARQHNGARRQAADARLRKGDVRALACIRVQPDVGVIHAQAHDVELDGARHGLQRRACTLELHVERHHARRRRDREAAAPRKALAQGRNLPIQRIGGAEEAFDGAARMFPGPEPELQVILRFKVP